MLQFDLVAEHLGDVRPFARLAEEAAARDHAKRAVNRRHPHFKVFRSEPGVDPHDEPADFVRTVYRLFVCSHFTAVIRMKRGVCRQ